MWQLVWTLKVIALSGAGCPGEPCAASGQCHVAVVAEVTLLYSAGTAVICIFGPHRIEARPSTL